MLMEKILYKCLNINENLQLITNLLLSTYYYLISFIALKGSLLLLFILFYCFTKQQIKNTQPATGLISHFELEIN